MAALEVAIDILLRAEQQEVRRKSQALGDLFIRLVEERCAGFSLEVSSPLDAALRGSQVALRHPQAYRIIRALIDAGVIGDFRPPDLMRFGFAPLYTRYVDIWDAVERLHQVLLTRAWQNPEYEGRLAVT
jgi:kynureninase